MSLFSKVAKFASSPQGRAAIEKAKTAATDPKNRAKIDGLVGKVKDKGRGGATPPPAADPTPGSQKPGQQP